MQGVRASGKLSKDDRILHGTRDRVYLTRSRDRNSRMVRERKALFEGHEQQECRYDV